MRVCLILEGCYPYVHGGVSTWMHEYINNTKDVTYTLVTIAAHKSDAKKFVYDLPSNVDKVYEYFLDDIACKKGINKPFTVSKKFVNEIKNLALGNHVEFDVIFRELKRKSWDLGSFINSKEYMGIIKDIASHDLKHAGYAQIFFNVRSMILPILSLLSNLAIDLPDADIYHSIVTGYGGVMASLLSYINHKPLILTEHGLYPREREEELMQASWVIDDFRSTWINFFYELSNCAYKYSNIVTCLFEDARKLQIKMGCDKNKTRVIANGINYEKFSKIPAKVDDGYIDIGAIIRFSPIKDVKTLIYAFYELKSKFSNVRLHIFGGTNDEAYKEECLAIIKNFDIQDIIIHGQVDVSKKMETLDFTILTSISEGQPLVILESYAAGRPVVCTNVGCCKEIVEGLTDNYGRAGYCCKPMDYNAIANAMYKLCSNKNKIKEYGENGRQRAKNDYAYSIMLKKYLDAYKEVIK